MIGPTFILQQDNNRKQTAKVIKNYLQCKREQEVLEVMACPPQSPNVSITRCVWDYTKTQKDWSIYTVMQSAKKKQTKKL